MDQQSFLNPTTCFTIACVAFSVLAVSTVWRGQQSSRPPSRKAARTQPQPRPGSLRRRRAVDSLYVEEGASYRTQLADLSEQAPMFIIDDLVQTYANISSRMRHSQQLEVPMVCSAQTALLQELSLLTTTLYRLRQFVASGATTFAPGSSQSSCLALTAGSINDLLSIFDADESERTSSSDALQQLREQRAALEAFSRSISDLPPTPPNETDLERSLKGVACPDSLSRNASVSSYMPDYTSSTGLTPAVDPWSWLEPPPKYSPSTNPAMMVAAEKQDGKSKDAGPPESQDETEELYDTDALHTAITSDNDLLADDLLNHGAEPDEAIGELQRTSLHQAAHLNHVRSLAVLLRHGASMAVEDAKGDTPLHLAAWAGHCEALSALLAHGADVDWLSGRDGYSPLWCAISAYHIDAARLLLKHGARVSLRSASGSGLLPLHQAAVTGQSTMCELLLEHGAQVDSPDDERNTPLHYAAASGSTASLRILLRSGADVILTQAQGLSPAHWAAHKGHTELLSLLLSYGAPVNARAEEGATPLHLAANRGHSPAARLLLEKGADHTLIAAAWDGVEGTASQMAQARGHGRVAKFIESWSKAR